MQPKSFWKKCIQNFIFNLTHFQNYYTCFRDIVYVFNCFYSRNRTGIIAKTHLINLTDQINQARHDNAADLSPT